MKLTLICCLLILINYTDCKAQKKFNNYDVTLLSDNDMYLFINQDRYYTNGVALKFASSLLSKKESGPTKVLEVSIGHRIYNGVEKIYNGDIYWDRPALGYFYLKTTLINFLSEKSVLSYHVDFANRGPKARGEEIQQFIHSAFNMYDVSGWGVQLKNKFGVDFSADYLYQFLKTSNSKFDISGKISSVIGMHNINAGVEFPIRFGKIKSLNQSIMTKGDLLIDEDKDEFYVFIKPGFYYNVKNLTVGESVSKDYSKTLDRKINPLIFFQQVGVNYGLGRSTLGASYILHSAEIKDLEYSYHQYGQIYYTLRF